MVEEVVNDDDDDVGLLGAKALEDATNAMVAARI